jgi:hypothetical protein
MDVMDLFAQWSEEFAAARAGDLGPLIRALKSNRQISRQVCEELADFLGEIRSLMLKRPAHRPKTIGATARLFMGKRLKQETACNMVDLILRVWNGDTTARQLLYKRDKESGLKIYSNVMCTRRQAQNSARAIELAAACYDLTVANLTNYRRRSTSDRRRR